MDGRGMGELVWSLRYDEPILVVAARQPWGRLVPEFSAFWITVPLAVLMAFIAFLHRRVFPQNAAVNVKTGRVIADPPPHRIVGSQRCVVYLRSGQRSLEVSIAQVNPRRVLLEWEPRHLVMATLGHGNTSITVTRYSSNADNDITGYVEGVPYDGDVNEWGPFLARP